MYTVDHTLGYHGKNFIRVKSSAYAHGTEIGGVNLKLLETTAGIAR